MRRPTLIELLVVISVVAVLVALVIPGVKWAASGSMRVPVRVLVFDATHGPPIANASVAIFWAPPLYDLKSLDESPDSYDSTHRVRGGGSGVTDSEGAVVINYEFRTGANHERPTMHVHVAWAWVHVKAEGFGGVVVPVRHNSLPTKTLREQKELVVPVGLTPER
jgi:hypothetical protein